MQRIGNSGCFSRGKLAAIVRRYPSCLFSCVQCVGDSIPLPVGGWGCSSVVRGSEFKSEDPGFDLMAGTDGGQFFCSSGSTLVQTCLCLTPLFVYTARTHICTHVKDPISICRKRVGLAACDIETRKHCTQEKKTTLVSTVQWLLTFPGESSPNFSCIALGQESCKI